MYGLYTHDNVDIYGWPVNTFWIWSYGLWVQRIFDIAIVVEKSFHRFEEVYKKSTIYRNMHGLLHIKTIF